MKSIVASLFIVLVICTLPLLFMVSFNAVAKLFWANAPSLSFVQAFAMVIMARIIFSGNPLGISFSDD